LTEGKIGGKLAYDVIDHKPVVNANVGETFQIGAGKIEFKDIDFRYPTRPELKVLKTLSCTFEPG